MDDAITLQHETSLEDLQRLARHWRPPGRAVTTAVWGGLGVAFGWLGMLIGSFLPGTPLPAPLVAAFIAMAGLAMAAFAFLWFGRLWADMRFKQIKRAGQLGHEVIVTGQRVTWRAPDAEVSLALADCTLALRDGDTFVVAGPRVAGVIPIKDGQADALEAVLGPFLHVGRPTAK